MVGPKAPDGEGHMRSASETTEEGEDVTLDPRVQQELGRALRAYTEDIINAPIPAKLLSLLARLEAQERRTK